MNTPKPFVVEYRDFLGQWRYDDEFATPESAQKYCAQMADMTGIAYRILQDGAEVDRIDFAAEFFDLGTDNEA